MPIISETEEMDLRKARHPLLERSLKRDGKEIVPLTVTLTPQKHILLISGPNAGGKSVCLKTVGLLQYMFQWGMLIPTSETSEMMVFDRIMADIGDGQSIDNDLSTYSSFLESMKDMLKEADSHTLVLIDEFGSGTEPAAGGAIAEAILNEFDKRGVYGVITTHYTNLKLYASGADTGVINGAMQFDAKNIAPLFKLEMGLPGNSFAFELARKMGLPEEIIKEIKRLVADGVVEVMLLGQNVNSYGKNLETPVSFAELLRMVNEVEGIERIRFMTSHPKDLSDELIQAMADCDKVCKYLHLPVQSGSDEILRRMNRHYTKESYMEPARKARAAMPDITLSTDTIVGPPGETEEDFQET